MPKAAVKRTLDYMLEARIRGEIKAQGVSVEKACEYAGADKVFPANTQAYALLVYPDCRRAGNDLLPVVREARD